MKMGVFFTLIFDRESLSRWHRANLYYLRTQIIIIHFPFYLLLLLVFCRVVSSEISGNLFQSFRKFPEIC